MADQVNIHAAKTHFSRLVERAEAGETIVIARDGRPAARLVPLREPAEEAGSSPPVRQETHRVGESPATYETSVAAPWTPPDAWLPAIVGRIVRLADPVRVILFGSRASGNAGPDSDYDVLVLLESVIDRRQERIRLRVALLDLPVSLDPVVAPVAEAAPGWPGPRGIVQWAAEGGRVIYERG